MKGNESMEKYEGGSLDMESGVCEPPSRRERWNSILHARRCILGTEYHIMKQQTTWTAAVRYCAISFRGSTTPYGVSTRTKPLKHLTPLGPAPL